MPMSRARCKPHISRYKRIRKTLVGAVGIENHGGRDFTYLRGMRRDTKPLKGNDGERKRTPVAPLMLPAFRIWLNSLGRQISLRYP